MEYIISTIQNNYEIILILFFIIVILVQLFICLFIYSTYERLNHILHFIIDEMSKVEELKDTQKYQLKELQNIDRNLMNISIELSKMRVQKSIDDLGK